MSNHDIIMVLSGLENICLIIGTVKSVLHEFQSYGPIYTILVAFPSQNACYHKGPNGYQLS